MLSALARFSSLSLPTRRQIDQTAWRSARSQICRERIACRASEPSANRSFRVREQPRCRVRSAIGKQEMLVCPDRQAFSADRRTYSLSRPVAIASKSSGGVPPPTTRVPRKPMPLSGTAARPERCQRSRRRRSRFNALIAGGGFLPTICNRASGASNSMSGQRSLNRTNAHRLDWGASPWSQNELHRRGSSAFRQNTRVHGGVDHIERESSRNRSQIFSCPLR